MTLQILSPIPERQRPPETPIAPRLARLEGKLAECEAEMGDPAVFADAGKVADLGRRQMQLRAELEQAEGELLALYG